MATLKPFRCSARSERGAELIEFALVLPLLLVVVLGIVDFGFLFQRLEVITNAAREGARMAVLPGPYSTTDVQTRVCDFIKSGGVDTTGCPATTTTVTAATITYDAGPPAKTMAGKTVVVTYYHSYLFLGPVSRWFGGNFSSVPLTGTATMRNE
jgi:Flp pilus assembly protein TadG